MHQGPTPYLIGGPNGAGKTTFAKEYLPNEVQCLRFYNSDEIAAGLSPLNPAAAQIQAARISNDPLKSRKPAASNQPSVARHTENTWSWPKRTTSASSSTSSGSPIPPNPGPVSKVASKTAATPSQKTPSTAASNFDKRQRISPGNFGINSLISRSPPSKNPAALLLCCSARARPQPSRSFFGKSHTFPMNTDLSKSLSQEKFPNPDK